MKKNTKIFNTEVIERLALSDNIPPFDEQRKGTQVIIIEEGKKTVIYDDYSMYCDADARTWKVEAYNRTDGRKYDRLCMCGGVYPTRKRAIAEIDRFAYRGKNLVFFVLPIDFTYDKKAMIWQGDEQYSCDDKLVLATKKELVEESKKRMKFMTDRMGSGKINRKKLTKAEAEALAAFDEFQKYREDKCYPYAIIGGNAVLYVSPYKNDWKAERECLDMKGDGIDGCVSAFVYNSITPETSEKGDIFFKIISNNIIRVA